MSSDHMTGFAGQFIHDFDPALGILCENDAYRLRVHYEDEYSFCDKLHSLLLDPQAPNLEGLVIGVWYKWVMYGTSSDEVVQELVRGSAKDRLSNLKVLFIGDIITSENEMSWIEQCNMTPVLDAYANLEAFGVRGGDSLRFSSLRHEKLKRLDVEASYLSPDTIADICAAHLPNLEHLELWLGDERYGEAVTLEDMVPILSGKFPKLTHLGFLNSQITNEIALALVNAPIMKQIKELDLSMGTLGDESADALIDALVGSSVKWLDISSNFLSHETIERLKKLPITLLHRYQSDYGGDPEDRYVSIYE